MLKALKKAVLKAVFLVFPVWMSLLRWIKLERSYAIHFLRPLYMKNNF